MCKPASFVLTKSAAHWSRKSDRHEDIIEEHGLHADGASGPNILRVEISPEDDKLDTPIDGWLYRVDQDVRPGWADPEKDEARARLALRDWYSAKVFTEGEHVVKEGESYAFDSASVRAFGSASVRAFDSASVRASGSASVEAFDSASVRASGSASVRASGSASVRAFGSASVRAFDSASVEAFDSASVEASGSASVEACTHRATVSNYGSGKICAPTGPYAVVIDRTGDKAVCTVGE